MYKIVSNITYTIKNERIVLPMIHQNQ
jgi:hypothetical protein